MADLKSYEVEECRACFEVYDTTGEGKIDAHYLGSLLRALDLSVTEETVKKHGGTAKLGEKMLSFEEFLPIYSDVKKAKDIGQIEDLLEGLKVYDKNENGTMMAAELAHVLLSLGEKLVDKEVDEIFTSCCPPEDEDGYIKYETLLKNIFAGPFPAEAKE
ncbi:myosin light chain 1-like isoform X1 [Argiope bruennichi]|uniref:Myosin light chain alkali like protein n=1 Tax=Argiope bruennichi TaxID=94029 RepID=A0A8T0FU59_ARGBR|nr:myosin light chain 1-like isoform X1 [Argiope bruennichi]KAF8794664.1 Myosin light chain alkali like protein [Argiope bruennichi]